MENTPGYYDFDYTMRLIIYKQAKKYNLVAKIHCNNRNIRIFKPVLVMIINF